MPEHRPDTATPGARPSGPVAVRAMLVGAPKAGTTSLYRYVAQHPDLLSHEQREFTYFFSDDEYDRGPDACAAKYLSGPRPERAPFFAKHVFTMYSPDALARLKAEGVDVQLFALLRDPVRRAYSSYWYSRRRGWDPAGSFEDAVRWENDAGATGPHWIGDRDRMHLRVGMYHRHIEHLLETFGRNRVHVFLTDDLAQDAAGLCRRVYELVGVDTGFAPDLARTHNPVSAPRSQVVARTVAGVLKSKGRVKRTVRRFIPHGLARRARHAVLSANEKPFTPPPMADDVRRELADYFAPHNEALGRLIDRDLSSWGAA